MFDSVEETEASENENNNKEPEIGKAKTSSTPANPLHRPVDHQPLAAIIQQLLEVDYHLFGPHQQP